MILVDDRFDAGHGTFGVHLHRNAAATGAHDEMPGVDEYTDGGEAENTPRLSMTASGNPKPK